MPKLVVRLLGAFRVELDGEAVYGFETDKARALLAYLVVEADRPHRRETLAGLLWPDQPDTVARARLRQTLHRVRQALTSPSPGDSAPHDKGAPPFLFVTPTDVQFNTASSYALDVAELEAFARQAGTPPHGELLPAALCADFLAGFGVPDSEAYESWVLSKQEQCHRLAIEILDAQGASFEASGDYERAIAAARLQLQFEPWLEEAHQSLMRCLALAGRQDEALHQYETCCRALRAELGAEPNAATQALHTDIRAGRLGTAVHPPALLATTPTRAGPSAPASAPTRLVARTDELEQLNQHLAAALRGETGVAFVCGDPGTGKTALLEAFAASALAEHPGLLVAGARCSPGGSLDAFAPLRRLAEMLFGDPASDAGWRLADPPQVDRLQQATTVLLAALAQEGPDLVDMLVPASSVARRTTAHGPGVAASSGYEGAPVEARDRGPQRALTQGELLDQLLRTLAAIGRKQPLLLLFDDLHWVDDASATFLLRMGRELSRTRLFVLGAYRSTTVALGRRDPRSGEAVRHPLAAVTNELRSIKGDILVDLDRADGRAFVEALVDTEANRLGARFRDALYAQTGGHALFTVESLRNLQARGELFRDEAGRWVARESLDWGALPARVEATIAERIDRLPEAERRILSAASVQGDDFTGEMVAELTGSPVPEVISCLSGSLARQHHLVRAERVSKAEGGAGEAGGKPRVSGRQPPPRASAEPSASGEPSASAGPRVRSTYRFTHHLFQKYLYDELDPVERVQWHAAVASALDRQAAGDPVERERLSPALAWHYEAGGLPLQAARALHDAGRQAMRVSAFREALSRFDHGLALLAKALLANEPSSEERSSAERKEVQRLLEVARLGPQRTLEGVGSAMLDGALTRSTGAGAAVAGGDASGRPELATLWWQAERLTAAGRFEEALALAERMRAEATQSGEEDLAGLPNYYCGAIHHHNGNPRESEYHLDWVFAWLSPERQARLRVSTGIDVLGTALALSALNKWFLGYPEAALARSREAIAGARAVGNLVGQAAANILGASLLFYLRVDEGAGVGSIAALSEECHRLCAQHGIRTWHAYADVLLGWQMVMRGEEDAGIERMHRAIAEWQTMGIAIGTGAYVVVLADACLAAAGRRSAGDDAARSSLLAIGLAAIEAMIGPVKVSCGQSYEAELHRLRGELLLARDGLAAAGEALDCFEQALALGREKGALAWELRAAMSLVRLRALQGEAYAADLVEARRCLAEVYGRFTQGFAFPDLQEAAALT